METLWNKRHLSPPPVVTFPVTTDAKSKTASFLTLLSDASNALGQTSALSAEYAVLDRLLYKFNNQLRKEKVIQSMKMIKQSLKRVAEMNMKAEFEKYCDSSGRTGSKTYLPSKQMLQYLLIRLMGYAHLLTRASLCCQESYVHCMQKLGRGDLVTQMLLFSSVTSRIWVLSRALSLQAIGWYKDLHPYCHILEGTQVDWLPPNETLPTDLHEWLGLGHDLREPKIHTRVYNLGLHDKSKVDLDHVLSRFSGDQNPSVQGTDDIPVSDGDDVGETALSLDRPTKPLDGGSYDLDAIASLDVGDAIDDFYNTATSEDLGVPVKDGLSHSNPATSYPFAQGTPEEGTSRSDDGTTVKLSSCKHDQWKKNRRECKNLAKTMVWEQGVEKCDDSMDETLKKFIKIELERYAKKQAKKKARGQKGVADCDNDSTELQMSVKQQTKEKKMDSDMKAKKRPLDRVKTDSVTAKKGKFEKESEHFKKRDMHQDICPSTDGKHSVQHEGTEGTKLTRREEKDREKQRKWKARKAKKLREKRKQKKKQKKM